MFCQAHSSPGINLLENLSNALVKILESCLHGPSQVLFADNSGSPFLFLSEIKIMQVSISKQISLGKIYICLLNTKIIKNISSFDFSDFISYLQFMSLASRTYIYIYIYIYI